MSSTSSPYNLLRQHLPIIILLIVALGLRLATQAGWLTGWWSNVTPLIAVAFVGAALLPRGFGWLLLGAVIAIDIVVAKPGAFQYVGGYLAVYAVLAAAIVWASRLHASFRAGQIGGLGILARLLMVSVGFYFLTNTMAWAMSAGYAKTLSGWWQAQTVGLPGFPPSWTFLRNSLISDLGFGSLLVAAHRLSRSRAKAAGSLEHAPAS